MFLVNLHHLHVMKNVMLNMGNKKMEIVNLNWTIVDVNMMVEIVVIQMLVQIDVVLVMN